MPERLFITLLTISLTTGIVILLIKLLSAFLNQNITARWKYWIWLVLAVRLIIPLHISLPVTPVEASIPNIRISTVMNDAPAQMEGGTGTTPSQAKTADPQNEAATTTDSEQFPLTLMEAAMIIWLLGFCGFLIYQITGYQMFRKKALRWSKIPANPQIAAALHSTASEMGMKRNITVLISGGVTSPLVIGFLKPKLFLPREDYPNTDLAFILRHELTHCKRNDLWYKLLLVCANAVHWFNPLVWMMFREASVDLEMSCDDEVTQGIGFDGRKAYGEAILASINGPKTRQTALTTCFSGGKNVLKNRLINILNTKRKKSGTLVLLTVVLSVGMLGTFVGCTTAGNEPSPTEPPAASIEGTGPFAGYVKDASVDTFDVYTDENGAYIMSLPMSLFDHFPASDRTDPNWQPGWMNIDVYCGSVGDFTWAVVCTGPSLGTGNANVCTSEDGGKTWWVGDKTAMYPGTVTGAGFASSEVGFISYRYFFDQGPEISRTLDGGKTWGRMTVEVPDDLKENNLTPLVPAFTGESGSYPIELYDSNGNTSMAYLTTKDGGMTWQWKGNDLDEAVKSAFLQDNQEHYLSGECVGEGHILLGHEEKSGVTVVYALTMYGEYSFEDGNFVKVSGSGIIPAVFTFTDSGDDLVCMKIEYPEDGARYGESIRRLFPPEYQASALSPSASDKQDLKSQERSYAEIYLKEIGRDAVIGDYGDFEHTLLTDVGVSVDVSNGINDKLFANYPMWIGNREALENGVRYVYEMSYNKEAHEIDFTKYEYDTNKIVELTRLDSMTGFQIK